jgi:hypothetical protein
MKKNIRWAWERFLNPDTLRRNLILASLYIAYFEILKESIIGRPKDFFATEWTENGPIESDKYKIQVLFRNKSTIYASLAWLLENNIIDNNDLANFEIVKNSRNELAHELTELIIKGIGLHHLDAFDKLIYLIDKIETWWIINIEIPINDDFMDKEIDISHIVPGAVAMLQVLLDVALGDEEHSKIYYEKFTNLIKRNNR